MFLHLSGAKLTACARVAAERLLRVRLRLLRMVAEAAIGVPARNKLLCVFLIDIHTLALDVWSIVAANIIRSLVRHNARRIERTADKVHRIRDVAIAVGILKPQDERPVIGTRKQIGIECRAQVADVHIARRTRCKTCANLRSCQRCFPQTPSCLSRADSCRVRGT